MSTIIQAKSPYLSSIYSMLIELASHEGIRDKFKITAAQLGELLFCQAPKHFVLLALDENEMVQGLLMYNFIDSNICTNLTAGIYIESFFVSSSYRQQGVGQKLFQALAKIAKTHDCSRIEWWVSRQNSAASSFYKKCGATILGQWEIYKCDKERIEDLIQG